MSMVVIWAKYGDSVTAVFNSLYLLGGMWCNGAIMVLHTANRLTPKRDQRLLLPRSVRDNSAGSRFVE
jgi:hypothetical protein